MRLNSRFLLYGIFVLIGILGMWLVMAAITAPPSNLKFNSNTTKNYDKEGNFTVNWTAATVDVNSTIANYSVYIFANNIFYLKATNNSATGYSFSNTTDANYTFIIEAVNKTSTEASNSTTNISMVVDTVNPALSYNSNTETNDSAASRDFVFVNVSASDINNVSSNLTFELYNGTGSLVRSNVTSYTTNTFNWTSLAEGKYIFNVTANDSATNSNSTSSRTFFLDRTNPTATATCSDIYEGDAFSCSCSGTDALTSVTTSESSTGSLTNTFVTGAFTYTCTATDGAGNTASEAKTYTILNRGGGGGGSTTPTLPKNSHSWSKMTPGVVNIMKDFNSEIGVKEIQITVNNEAQNVQITVTKYDGKPAEVSVSKSGKVYQYLQIDAQNLGNNLDKATVQFRVEKSWASSNGLDKDEIAVYKLNGRWDKLETTYVSEDSQYYYYDVELDSFSYFAIGEGDTVVSEATIGGTTEEGRNKIWVWVLAALVLIVAIWWMRKR